MDKNWFKSIIMLHILFYYGLNTDNRKLLDILHPTVTILPFLALFCASFYPKLLSFSLLFVIQILWLIKGRCILNKENEKGINSMSVGVIITITFFLLFQIIYEKFIY